MTRAECRSRIFQMITERRQRGRVFVFLGADQGVYAEGESVGVSARNWVAWEKSKAGTAKLWNDAAHSTASYRAMDETERRRATDDFFEEDPGAER